MRINNHARIEIAIAAILILGSCSNSEFKSKFNDVERDEIGDIAGDVSYDTVLEHEKVRELESRIEALEMKLGM